MGYSSAESMEATLRRFAVGIVANAAVLEEEQEQKLLSAFRNVPRHWFCDEVYTSDAYLDDSVPSEFGQLLSRPSVVCRMMSLLPLHGGARVLEVGSGSGYTAALLSQAGCFVYGIEAVGLLCQKARKRLDTHAFPNILLKPGNGFDGWKEQAPFHGIVVWTPCWDIEDALFDQLSPEGGTLVAAVGGDNEQLLHAWVRRGETLLLTKFEKVSLLGAA